MRKRTVMVIRNGEMKPMDMVMTLSNGIKVMMDGTVVMRDGTNRMLTDGEALTMDGEPTTIKDLESNMENKPED